MHVPSGVYWDHGYGALLITAIIMLIIAVSRFFSLCNLYITDEGVLRQKFLNVNKSVCEQTHFICESIAKRTDQLIMI